MIKRAWTQAVATWKSEGSVEGCAIQDLDSSAGHSVAIYEIRCSFKSKKKNKKQKEFHYSLSL